MGVSASKPTQQSKEDAVLGHGSIGSPAAHRGRSPYIRGVGARSVGTLFFSPPQPCFYIQSSASPLSPFSTLIACFRTAQTLVYQTLTL